MLSSISKPETKPYTLHLGDCLEVLPSLPDNSVDAVVTDPPYGLSFMGKNWDHGVPGVEFWAEAMRVAKPGAHLLAFGGTRTYHRLACAIEDAGWEIRDCVMWVYGSGFPKSHDVSKAIDKAAGAEREKVLVPTKPGNTRGERGISYAGESFSGFTDISEPATDAARQWSGWGTALKPAYEPCILARKPLQGTVAENVLRHGTGAINVDGCRVGTERTVTVRNGDSGGNGAYGRDERVFTRINPPGRWPANLIHDGSDEVMGLMPVTTSNPGTLRSDAEAGRHIPVAPVRRTGTVLSVGDTGSAARFFQACPDTDPEDAQARLVYCAKASKRDRDEGCEGMEAKANADWPQNLDGDDVRGSQPLRNHHPTVKPTTLLRYLCRLITPPGGVVLDPFMGSGSTGKACGLEGFRFIGIEQSLEYMPIASARVAFGYGTPAPVPEPAPAPPEPAQEDQLSLF